MSGGEAIEREQLEGDVLIVGGGPSGLACAIRLAQLIEEHNTAGNGPELSAEEIYLIEKGEELGMHSLSGAVMNPRGLRELFPDLDQLDAPMGAPVSSDSVYFMTRKSAFRAPITPPPLKNHGKYVVSLAKLVQWLGGKAEEKEVNIFTGFAGSELIVEDNKVCGVITDDKGIDKHGKQKENFQAGYELRAKVTVLAEGPHGSLTKGLIRDFGLDRESNPQVFALGVKEVWSVPAGRVKAGQVWHTMGHPLGNDIFGGGWLYGIDDERVSIGLVCGLEYKDPRFDPHQAFQEFKRHPLIANVLDGGKLIRYGAKTIPEGGYWAMPRPYVDGALISGDSAGFLNGQSLKGIHLAIKSGMLAAETVFEALKCGDTSAATLASYKERFEQSWAKDELWKARNFHQGFKNGLWSGLFHAGLQFLTGGRGLRDRYSNTAGHEHYAKLSQLPAKGPEAPAPDGTLTFDKATDVYHSGTRHEEDQPSHLIVEDTDVCSTRCAEEYGNPCQYFCPAAVYEMTGDEGDKKQLKINASNCVHCKTCDIMDPYQIIRWVPPEGGGGPHYEGM